MKTTLKRIAVASTAAAFGLLGFAFLSIHDLATSVVYGVQQRATSFATAAAESTAEADRTDADREAILGLINSHRQTASPAWRARLAEAIYTEATLADMDPLMVASIVAKESSFKSRVVSNVGAVGLMQLRPFVAQDVARRGQIEWNGIETLHSPDLNVRLGILYYKELVERFEGDHHVALTAYNQGPTRVSLKLRRGTYAGSAYATDILGMYESIRGEIEV